MTRAIQTVFVGLAVLLGCTTAAIAAPPHTDTFSRTTNDSAYDSQTPQGPREPIHYSEVATKWFDGLDHTVASHLPTKHQRFILSRDFGQQVERVVEWTNTAAQIAMNYRELARQLRAMQVPSLLMTGKSKDNASVYKTSCADWYDDAAGVLEDYIKPRKPARTQEELQASLDEMHQRSESLVQQDKALKLMDSDLRAQFHVHPPQYADPLMKYVTSPIR